MYPLFETIRLEDGVFFNLNYHQQRMKRSVEELFNRSLEFDLYILIRSLDYPSQGIHKCRIEYDNASLEISFHPYTIRVIDTLIPVRADYIDYHLKYTDRFILNEIGTALAPNEEVLILINEKVTDTRYTNVICKKNNQWYTPVDPLLKGTQREFLLNQGLLTEIDISFCELKEYDEVALINAMIPFERRIVISNISNKYAIE